MKKTLLSLLALVITMGASAQTKIDFNDIASLGLSTADFVTVPNGDSENTYYEITAGEGTTGVIGDSNVKITVAQNESKTTAKIWKTTSGAYEFRTYKGHTVTIALKNGKSIVKIAGNGGAQLNYSGDPKAEVVVNLTETAKIKSLEITASGESVDPEPQPEVEHITIADFLDNADTETTYELTGTVQNIKNTLYGNFDLVENGASIYIYGLLDLEGNAKNFESLGITEGTVITVTGVYYEYAAADGTVTPEIKNAQLVRIESGNVDPVDPVDPDQPQTVTVTEALNIINGLADGTTTTEEYVLEGTITTLDEISTQYGNATFMLSDGAQEIKVFRCKDLGNQKFTDENAIKVGDKVKLQGKLQKYVKNGE
ncbi:MAG: hypothetical protein Q4D33_05495, partial [Prevotellaceae bacterium]|nr:hypothetical protein [Prevotellaceae bacterium]